MHKRFSKIKVFAVWICIFVASASTSTATEIFVSKQLGFLEFRKAKLKQDKKGAKIVGRIYSKHFHRVKQGSHMHINVYDAEGTLLESINESTERRVFHQKHRDKRSSGYIFPDHVIRLKSDFSEIALVKIYVYGTNHYEYEIYDG